MFRISRKGHEPIEVEKLRGIGNVMRSSKPGIYQVDEITADPAGSSSTSRRWGTLTTHADGSVVLHARRLAAPRLAHPRRGRTIDRSTPHAGCALRNGPYRSPRRSRTSHRSPVFRAGTGT